MGDRVTPSHPLHAMRILLLSKSPLTRRLGAGKLLIELAAALEARGAACTLVDPDALGTDRDGFAAASAAYLRTEAARFDVVEFEYNHLRLADLRTLLAGRADSSRPAYVARCQLWRGHLLAVPPPPLPRPRSRLRRTLFGRRARARLAAAVTQDRAVMAAADLALVSNAADRAHLVRHGLDGSRIAVVAPGLDAETAAELGRVALIEPDPEPTIAFIGTFDERKGGGDFPALAAHLARCLPGVRLRLLGTAGMLPTASAVLGCFPRALRPRLDVVPRYDPADLAGHLAGCAAGVFPSYAEGFGYGVLEMLAAGLPVVAYDRPGPPAMLPPEHLVPAGRPDLLADVLARLLRDPAGFAETRAEARERALRFDWGRAAAETMEAYESARARRTPSALALR